MREKPRRRRAVPPRVLRALSPILRYSTSRSAWILRGIGDRFGPVLLSTAEPPTYINLTEVIDLSEPALGEAALSEPRQRLDH